MKVKAVISYDGSKFHGFQQQKSTDKTVHTTVQKALISLGIDSDIIGSGRTDAGVHASGQVISFDLPNHWSDKQALREHLNNKLKYIYIKHISQVDENFHARFSAKRRIYRYIFKTTPQSVFETDYVSFLAMKDTKKLKEALSIFVGRHDFEYFRKSGSETKNSIREIYSSKYIQRGEYHYIYFEANGYLRAQVRMMIDASIKVANGELLARDLAQQLERKAKYTHTPAPAQGLYLARVLY